MNNIKAVIFDMDGVIIDSEPIHVLAERAVIEKYGIFADQKDWESFKGKTAVKIFSEVINKYKVQGVSAGQMADEKLTKYLELFNSFDIKLFDGCMDTLEYLQHKYLVALTTSSHYKLQQAVFKKFKLGKYFKVVVTGDMVTKGKPDPEPYLLTVSKLGLKPVDCLVIEDSDNGVTSAKLAGIRTIAITNTFSRERLCQAEVIIDSLTHIQGIL